MHKINSKSPGHQIPVISVSAACTIPDEAEIQARFPQFSQEQVAGLHEDYDRERVRLERICDEYDFDDTLEYIKRLAARSDDEVKMES
jgi:hypothetical protein